MIDFLRTISPYIYTLIPILIILFVIYKVVYRNTLDENKGVVKKVYLGMTFLTLLFFAIAVIRMVMINEVPQSDVDHSIKKERNEWAIDQAKQDTTNIN